MISIFQFSLQLPNPVPRRHLKTTIYCPAQWIPLRASTRIWLTNSRNGRCHLYELCFALTITTPMSLFPSAWSFSSSRFLVLNTEMISWDNCRPTTLQPTLDCWAWSLRSHASFTTILESMFPTSKCVLIPRQCKRRSSKFWKRTTRSPSLILERALLTITLFQTELLPSKYVYSFCLVEHIAHGAW